MPTINSFPINTKTFEELKLLTNAQSTQLDRVLVYDESDGVVKAQTLGERDKGKVIPIDNITEFSSIDYPSLSDRQQFHLNSFAPNGVIGGGPLAWSPDLPKSLHDGVKYFSPTVPVPTDFNDPVQIQNYLDGIGEEFPTEDGVFALTLYSIASSESPVTDGQLVVFDGPSGNAIKKGPIPTELGVNLIELGAPGETSFAQFNNDGIVSLRTINQTKTDLSIPSDTIASLGEKISGPSSSANDQVALFDGISGKLLKAGQTLTQIFNGWLVQLYNNFPRTVNAFSDLSATPSVGAGQIIQTKGHTVPGLGSLKYISKSGSVTNNGGTQCNSATAGIYWDAILDGFLSPLMFGAVGDGIANDLVPIQAMFATTAAGHRNFNFEGKLYFLGSISVYKNAKFTFNNVDNLRIYGNPNFKVTTAFATQDIRYESIFLFIDCSYLYCECKASGEAGFDTEAPQPSGIVGISLLSDTKDAHTVELHSTVSYGVSAIRGDAAWTVDGYYAGRARLPSDPYYTNIKYTAQTYYTKYGVNFNSCGDNQQGEVVTTLATRSYFITGISNAKVTVNSHKQRSITDILIKAYRDNVNNISVIYNQTESNSTEDAIAIEHDNELQNTKIDNVTIDATIDRPAGNILMLGTVDILTTTYRATTTTITSNIDIRVNGFPPAAGFGMRIRTQQSVPAIIRTNRIFELFGNTSRGYTLQTGSDVRALSQSTTPSISLLFDSVKSSVISALVNVRNTSDYTDVNAASTYSAIWHVNFYRLSAGAGAIVSSSVIYKIFTGTEPIISFSVVNGALVISSNMPGANCALSASASASGDRF